MGVTRTAALLGAMALALGACNKAADANGSAAEAPAAGAPFSSAGVPQLKPGFWETTTANESFPGGGGGFALRMCYDEAMAKEVNLMQRRGGPGGGGGPGDGPECQQTITRQADGSWQGNSVCETPIGKMTSVAVIRGDFSSAYTVDVTTKAEGENVPPMMAEGMKTTINAKRLGDCPAGYVGGDTEFNGQKVSAAEREQRQAERRERFQGNFGPGGPGGPGGGGPAPEGQQP